ncbi:MAG: nucleotide exchange factor GrpE [Firmicutes bacterium]|nr:nucleotide exchange factor GrpE [Bacillota bacterium]
MIDNQTSGDSKAMSTEDLEKKIEILEAIQVRDKRKIEELSALADRMQIDFDNFRKRTREEAKKLKDDGICEAIEQILPTIDVLAKAIQMIEDKKVADGLKMIYKQLAEALAGFGLKEIVAHGKPFDPKLHNAVMQSRTKDPARIGYVTEVLQKGYILGEKVIRHASVKVAK